MPETAASSHPAGLSKVLLIGSGPIIIGQAAEFDYSGTQACRALREAGCEIVLVNSNPATIMTDAEVADRVYIEPLIPEVVQEIIARERPQGLIATMGGQTALNLAMALHDRGALQRFGVQVLGTPIEAVARAEDRALFKATMAVLGEPLPVSETVDSPQAAVEAARRIGLPVVVRPAFTLGGSGGGIAATLEEVEAIAFRGLSLSRIGQVLVEQSVAGWKEIEYEVLRDGAGNAITVCNMENVDPMGVHTGDSIVVAPSQTLSDRTYHRLRSASLRIVHGLNIQGACNVQFALEPAPAEAAGTERYCVIEVNPRVSRSSALASKATGYPIARVATQIALGRRLDQITNAITGGTACFEPALDYVVIKIPRWPFDKFPGVDRSLGTQMKSTGEAMALGRTFEEALLKAVRSLDAGAIGLWHSMVEAWSDDDLWTRIRTPHEHRLFALAEALRRGAEVEALQAATGIDAFFVGGIARIVAAERAAAAGGGLDEATLRQWLRLGLDDRAIARCSDLGPRGLTAKDVRARRLAAGLRPTYKSVDTCAGEFPAGTPYFYGTYEDEDEIPRAQTRTAVVLGSGPIRIGQGIEFDYCTVHAVQALKQAGWEAVVINNNPETVSTDFDLPDRLYVEPLTPEDIRAVVEREGAQGVLVQFGGQTPLNAAMPLAREGVRVLGTAPESLDISEDRRKFAALLRELDIPQPSGWTATTLREAVAIGEREGLPLLVRPSYVLGGRGMIIARTMEDLRDAAAQALTQTAAPVSGPLLLDRYLEGLEVELDAVADGANLIIPSLMEHIERAGIHSGDSMALLPARSVAPEAIRVIVEYASRIAWALQVRGFLNIQFVIWRGAPYVLEVNLRASRTVPFVSKATGVPLVRLATEVMLGRALPEFGYAGAMLLPRPARWAVKAPVFSSGKLFGADPLLGPEMRSTGEVMGTGPTAAAALRRAFVAAGFPLELGRALLLSVADRDKTAAADLAAAAVAQGFTLLATPGTAAALAAAGLSARQVSAGEALRLIRAHDVDVLVNTPTRGYRPDRAGFALRRAAFELNVPALTSLDSARALLEAYGAPARADPLRIQ